MSLDEGTLVRYHGGRQPYVGDLAFIRDSKIGTDDRRHYLLDLVCYQGTDAEHGEYITTFGSIKATRDEFTVIELPALPEPLALGNYLVHGTPWRKTAQGWYTWANYSEQWKAAPGLTDASARGDMAVYIGPLPN